MRAIKVPLKNMNLSVIITEFISWVSIQTYNHNARYWLQLRNNGNFKLNHKMVFSKIGQLISQYNYYIQHAKINKKVIILMASIIKRWINQSKICQSAYTAVLASTYASIPNVASLDSFVRLAAKISVADVLYSMNIAKKCCGLSCWALSARIKTARYLNFMLFSRRWRTSFPRSSRKWRRNIWISKSGLWCMDSVSKLWILLISSMMPTTTTSQELTCIKLCPLFLWANKNRWTTALVLNNAPKYKNRLINCSKMSGTFTSTKYLKWRKRKLKKFLLLLI